MPDKNNAAVSAPPIAGELSIESLATYLAGDSATAGDVGSTAENNQASSAAPEGVGDATGADAAGQEAGEASVPIESHEGEAESEQPSAASDQPEAEAEAEAESEQPAADDQQPEAEAEAEPKAGEDGFKPITSQDELNRLIGKRLAKAEAKAKEAVQSELETLRRELAKVQNGGKAESAVAVNGDFVEADPGVREAKQELTKHTSIKATANDLLRQLRQDPEAVAQRLQQAQVKLRDYSEDGIREYLESAKEESMTQAAAAAARLTLAQERAKAAVEAQRRSVEALAVQEFPELADPNSELSQRVEAALELRPWLRNDPIGRFAAAAASDRLMKAQAKQKAQPAPAKPGVTATVKPKVKLPVSTPKRTLVPPKQVLTTGAGTSVKRFEQTGSPEDLEEVLKARL